MTSHPNSKFMESLIVCAQVLDWLSWVKGPSQAYQLGKRNIDPRATKVITGPQAC